MTEIFGTLGPACSDEKTLTSMFSHGMTGMRINLSHGSLKEEEKYISLLFRAAEKAGVRAKLIIDMQGPEVRIGKLEGDLLLKEGDIIMFGNGGISIDRKIIPYFKKGQSLLLDDGKILLEVKECCADKVKAKVARGGLLGSRKSLAILDCAVNMPTMTEEDRKNIALLSSYNVSGVMQPFVRNKEDLLEVKKALSDKGCENVKLYAKVENKEGVSKLDDFIAYADEIVIARGDLGTSMPLWHLPLAQKEISAKCVRENKPFMVVTEMLSSMAEKAVPTRAEVNDIFNSVLDGASSIMVTGESAVGKYPVEVIKYLSATAKEAEKYRDRNGAVL